MAQNAEIIEALNDLIVINNDRLAGYEKAYDETNEIENDLRALFNTLGDQSRVHVIELSDEVVSLGGEPETGTMTSGKLYRVWMDIRAVFTFDNRRAVLENAEGIEDAARKAYEEALRSMEFPADINQMLLRQQNAITSTHDTIMKERDRQRDIPKYPLTT
ncbi:PA2169 family four-helix-bundle protein [Dyadobacter sp. CY343]|uniref:ferritin-like domain-containing protein n=1 Tax=Dyadobacter sp. CY343 TaxID=2907299 RepID=UPI001F22AEA3|nr:PA2169 family four-helix-bundle protein [Dyadobacter sp. CY343]MCE7060443.1 PA2169 family four-helix-bundle protein [Dyadobacter sp. CY343]